MSAQLYHGIRCDECQTTISADVQGETAVWKCPHETRTVKLKGSISPAWNMTNCTQCGSGFHGQRNTQTKGLVQACDCHRCYVHVGQRLPEAWL